MTFFTSPGILSEKMYAFTAYNLQQSDKALEEGEDIEVHPIPLAEALEMVRTGQIQDGKTVAALLYYASFRRSEER